MSHYAVIAPPFFSHFRALEALAQALMIRGHKVTFIHQSDAVNLLIEPEIAFQPIGAISHPAGTLARTLRLTANSGGLSTMGLIKDMACTTDMLCRELPRVLDKLVVEGLIVDQMEPAGGLVAELLGLPFVSVACALPINRETGLPLPVMPFKYATHPHAHKLYQASQRFYDWMMQKHTSVINRHARAFGLSSRQGIHECLSPLAQISQTIAALDFPRSALPASYHAVGPLRKAKKTDIKRWPASSSRPFVFASLGTLQGHRFKMFKTIARACRSLDAQLLIAHCGGLDPAQADLLQASGANWVTDFAEQTTVLQQAQVVVTHGGLNTVSDAVQNMTPVLAMPITFDQPGVAARVVWSGIGRQVSRFCSSDTLAKNLHILLSDNSYRQHISNMQAQLNTAGGAEQAASIVEQALSPPSAAITKVAF